MKREKFADKRKAQDEEFNCVGQLWSVKEVANRLKISVRSVWRMDKEQEIPSAKNIGHKKLWDANDLELWLLWNCPDRKEFNKIKSERNSNAKRT